MGGDELVQEMERAALDAKQAWHDKVVVCNTHFKVNTRVPHSQQLNKFGSVRENHTAT